MVWCSPDISLTRAHYELYAYRYCVAQTAHDPRKSELGSIELPKYAHWAVLPLDHPVRHSTVPYSRWSYTIFLLSEHPCLTAVHKDGLGPSQAPPTTISPLQLLSYGVVQDTDYEDTISSSRWEVQVPYPTYRVRGHVSPIRTLQHLSFLCTWERPWCTPRMGR